MSVYVDNYGARYGRIVMSHMMAGSMADIIGVQRKWIQYQGTYKEHFDVCQSKRKLAIQAGAKEVSCRWMDRFILARKTVERAKRDQVRDQVPPLPSTNRA